MTQAVLYFVNGQDSQYPDPGKCGLYLRGRADRGKVIGHLEEQLEDWFIDEQTIRPR